MKHGHAVPPISAAVPAGRHCRQCAPEPSLCRASRTVSSRISSEITGRPALFGKVQCFLTSRRCQASMVPGVTTRCAFQGERLQVVPGYRADVRCDRQDDAQQRGDQKRHPGQLVAGLGPGRRSGADVGASRTHKNIARGRRFSISSRSRASSLGFSAAVNASAKNSAFTAGQPASVIVPCRRRLPAAAPGASCLLRRRPRSDHGPRTR